MSYEIWHNARCSKSRQTLALLEEAKVEIRVRNYLEEAPSIDEISTVLDILGVEASDIVRKKETLFKELNLGEASSIELLDAMAKNPKLIERPIVLHDGQGVIGRPPENVKKLF